jgi:hypothetical protein
MIYHFNEGSVAVPDGLKDRTMHMLAPTSGANFNFIISHDELEPGETPPEFLQRQLDDLARQVNKFTELSRTPTTLGAPDSPIKGVQLEIRYKQQGKFLHHLQAAFLMPDGNTILTFTASLPKPFTEEERGQFQQIVASFSQR